MPESSSLVSTATILDIRQLPWIRRLPADYAHAFERLAPFYAGDPRAPEARRDAVARTLGHPRDRRRLVEMLRRQQVSRDAPLEARAATERLLDERCVAVVTGQQAGVAGGPLFTLLKAITAIRLAATFERDYGVPAVAVFWIDAEDHDWDEVAAVTLLDGDGHPQTLRLPSPPGANQVPVASLALDTSVDDFMAAIRATLPATEFTDEIVGGLRKAYRAGRGMAEAFGRLLEGALGSKGLILYDCSDLAAKPLVAHIFTQELADPGRTWELATEAGKALEARGYHAQVGPHPDGVALFYLAGERQAIRRDGSSFLAGTHRFAAADLVAQAETEPQRFSPNVLLRPLVQDALFPTVAYVGGPSELAYLGQLKPVYAEFGIPMPVVVSRATATILDGAAARFVSRYHLAFHQFQRQDEAELNHLLESLLPPHVEASLLDAQRALEERMNAVIDAVPAIDPTLGGAARSTLGRIVHDLRTLHTKVIHAAKKKDETLRRQFVRTRSLIFPEGHPQERTIGFAWFLNRYGPALIDILERNVPEDGSVHALLTP